LNFLIAAFQTCSCTEASRCLPSNSEQPAHDAVQRLLERQPPHTEALYNEAKQLIRQNEGVLVIDDSTLDKPYSRQIELVTRHWSGKHHRVVQGINLISTIWTDGTAIVPVDFRIYNHETDGKTKNDHFRDMIKAANDRQFHPACVVFESWYASIENITLIRSMDWRWFTRLKSNRLVNPDNTANRQISEIDIPPEGESSICANMGSSRFSRWFMRIPMLNIGLRIFWMHQNRTDNRSKGVDGISKNIIGGLSSAAGLRNVRGGKRRSNVDISSSR